MSAPTPSSDWSLEGYASLPEVCREKIADAIRTGRLRPGERIVELSLSAMLGVSRGSLREALKALEAQGLVVTHRSRGSFVARVTREQMAEMTLARAALEGMAARIVADRADPRALAALGRVRRAIVAAGEAGQADAARAHNLRFHESVCESAGNGFILRSWRSLSDLIRLFLHDNRAFEAGIDDVLERNRQLMAALAGGDGDAAEEVFRRLLVGAAEAQLGVDLLPRRRAADDAPAPRRREAAPRPAGRRSGRGERRLAEVEVGGGLVGDAGLE